MVPGGSLVFVIMGKQRVCKEDEDRKEARGMLMPYRDIFFRFDRMLLVTNRKLHSN